MRSYLGLKAMTIIYKLSYFIQFCSPNVSATETPNLFFLTCIIILKIYKKYWRYMSLNVVFGFVSLQNLKKFLLSHVEYCITLYEMIETKGTNNFYFRGTCQ